MLSVPHLVIIFLVALIVFGPEKLPELARSFGKVMAEFRRATGDLKSGFEEHMRELERETRLNDMKARQSQSSQQSNTILPPPSAVTEPPSEPPDAGQSATAASEPRETASSPEKPTDGV
jgi:TatA/E family protein of Tat protein translocase